MTDVRVRWNNADGRGDLFVVGADLERDDSLETAVLVSLFTDRRADPDELPAGETDRRGWWGDVLAEDDDQIGSRLWLLDREKQTDAVIVRTEEYAREALAWLIEDGEAESVAVAAEWVARGIRGLCVTIGTPRGAREYQFTLGA